MTQAVPVVNELLGQGNGEPDQMVTLANTPVFTASVRLVVEDDEWHGATVATAPMICSPPGQMTRSSRWMRSLARCVSATACAGQRPPAERRILASYEYGGGLQGNVGIGAIKTSRDARLQGGYKIDNPLPTSGGSLGQSVAEGERDMPLVLRHRDRLVTLQDFEDVARRTPGVDVGRVEVLPLFLPSNPQEAAPGVVTVMVVPKFDALRPLWPTPDRLFLRRVCDHLDPAPPGHHGDLRPRTEVCGGVCVGWYPGARWVFPRCCPAGSRHTPERLSVGAAAGRPGRQRLALDKRLMRKDLEAVVTRVPGVEFVESLELGVKTPVDIPEYDLTGLELPMLVAWSVQEGAPEPLASIVTTLPSTDPSRTQVVHVPVTKTKC